MTHDSSRVYKAIDSGDWIQVAEVVGQAVDMAKQQNSTFALVAFLESIQEELMKKAVRIAMANRYDS